MIKKIFILFVIICQLSFQTMAFSEKDIADLELQKYGKIYKEDDLGSRLRRLETDVFGMSQSGNIDVRMNNLFNMISPTHNYQGLYPTETFLKPEKKGFIRKFFDNVTSSFSYPYVTGYSPSLFEMNGYPNNIYKDNHINLSGNNGNYCSFSNPYPHRYFNGAHRFHHPYGNTPYYNNGYSPYIYTPPTDITRNVATRSTVHILRD
ncbi:hypothetical protein IJD44_11325 [bacterium]|nr:hypothetical protein [bacterium]